MKESPQAEMPFLDHLEELRQRLIRAGAAFIIGVILAFIILTQTDLIGFLQRPIRPYLAAETLIYTHPGAVFGILMDIAFVLGAIIASPVIGYQLWLFLAPALYPHERRLAIPLVAAMVLLFTAGVALAFFVVLPLTLRFLLGLQTGSLTPMITATEYFGFAVTMSLMFGLVFELPIAILALTVLGVVTPAFLVRYRRHAVVLCLVLAAFVTPGADPTSMLALAVPLYLLFEVSVVAASVVYRRRERRLQREGRVGAAAGADVSHA
ncbi:MAG TPA: twin-arginine translocase subunit TatC [Gemmatimonadaceae bacterium]|nr:twin-arginine translocase subunit TatC [Gemmatimonadaceae bacterium]